MGPLQGGHCPKQGLQPSSKPFCSAPTSVLKHLGHEDFSDIVIAVVVVVVVVVVVSMVGGQVGV